MCNPSAVLLITGRGSTTRFSSSSHAYFHAHVVFTQVFILPHLFDLSVSLLYGFAFSTHSHLFPSSNTIICSCEVASPPAAYKRQIDLLSFICTILSLLHHLYCTVKGCEIFGLISHSLPFQNTLPTPSPIFGSMLLGQSAI